MLQSAPLESRQSRAEARKETLPQFVVSIFGPALCRGAMLVTKNLAVRGGVAAGQPHTGNRSSGQVAAQISQIEDLQGGIDVVLGQHSTGLGGAFSSLKGK